MDLRPNHMQTQTQLQLNRRLRGDIYIPPLEMEINGHIQLNINISDLLSYFPQTATIID